MDHSSPPPYTSTLEELETWADKELMVGVSLSEDDYAISLIEFNRGRDAPRGAGAIFLCVLCQRADALEKQIRGTVLGGNDRLVGYYSRFGFKTDENTRCNETGDVTITREVGLIPDPLPQFGMADSRSDTEMVLDSRLFHATFEHRVDSIMCHGLGAVIDQRNYKISQPGTVYLSDNPDSADEYATNSHATTGKVVVLEIDATKLDLSKMELDVNDDLIFGGNSYAYKAVIPPSLISGYGFNLPSITPTTYYHGCESLARSAAIIEHGLKAQDARQTGKWVKHQIPMPGRVYLTPDLGAAIDYANEAGRSGDREAHVFEVPLSHMTGRLLPDEDEVGAAVMWASSVLAGGAARWGNVDNFAANLRRDAQLCQDVMAFAQAVLSPEEIHEVVDGMEDGLFARTGKRILETMPDSLAQRLIAAGCHVSCDSPVMPTQAWRFAKNTGIRPTNFFEEAMPVDVMAAQALQERAQPDWRQDWFHWTPYEFKTFKRGEMGIHFGSREQATDIFLKHRMGGDGRFITARLDYREPFKARKDVGDWSSQMRWLDYLSTYEMRGQQGSLDLTQAELMKLSKPLAQTCYSRVDFGLKVMMPFLKRRGFDTIEYANGGEGTGRYNGEVKETAVLVFDPTQVRILSSEPTGHDQRALHQPHALPAQITGSAAKAPVSKAKKPAPAC